MGPRIKKTKKETERAKRRRRQRVALNKYYIFVDIALLNL
jgi:hypothetical protein